MTVSRELERLIAADWVREHRVGSVRFVEPNPDLPISTSIRQLVASSVGVLPQLREAFESDGRVVEAFVFGSWARRWHGEPGRWPADVDVAIIAKGMTRTAAYELVFEIGRNISIEINPRVYDPTRLDPVTAKNLETLRTGSVEVFHRG